MKAKYAIKTDDDAIQDLLQTIKHAYPRGTWGFRTTYHRVRVNSSSPVGKTKEGTRYRRDISWPFSKNMGNNQKWPANNNEHNVYEWRSTWITKIWSDNIIPKIKEPNRPTEFRPLTLLNTDFKLLSRLITNRTRQRINVLLHPSRCCGAHDNKIYGAIATIRETIANAELTNTPTCILTLDF
jgi:hypothetical protein